MIGPQGGSGPGWYFKGKHYSGPQELHEAMNVEMDKLRAEVEEWRQMWNENLPAMERKRENKQLLLQIDEWKQKYTEKDFQAAGFVLELDAANRLINEVLIGVELVEHNCPCGARPESLHTHPHVTNCLVEGILNRLRSKTEKPVDGLQIGESRNLPYPKPISNDDAIKRKCECVWLDGGVVGEYRDPAKKCPVHDKRFCECPTAGDAKIKGTDLCAECRHPVRNEGRA